MGNKVSVCFDAFCRSHPEAAKAAEGYGTPGFHLEGVAEWRQALEKHFKLEDTKPALDLKGLLEYKTPVNVNLLEAWAKSAGDPDEEVACWLRTGAPLGANLPIRTCGIFPAKEVDDSKSYEASVAAQEWAKLNNYKSFTDNQKDSDVEMERLVSLGLREEADHTGGRALLLPSRGVEIGAHSEGGNRMDRRNVASSSTLYAAERTPKRCALSASCCHAKKMCTVFFVK